MKITKAEALEKYPTESESDVKNRNNMISKAKAFEKSTAVRKELYYALKNKTDDFIGKVYDKTKPQDVKEFTIPGEIKTVSTQNLNVTATATAPSTKNEGKTNTNTTNESSSNTTTTSKQNEIAEANEVAVETANEIATENANEVSAENNNEVVEEVNETIVGNEIEELSETTSKKENE